MKPYVATIGGTIAYKWHINCSGKFKAFNPNREIDNIVQIIQRMRWFVFPNLTCLEMPGTKLQDTTQPLCDDVLTSCNPL
jgi:hypothetical protein